MAAMSPPILCYLFFFHDRFEQLIFFNQSLFGGWYTKRYKPYLNAVRNDAHCLNVLLQISTFISKHRNLFQQWHEQAPYPSSNGLKKRSFVQCISDRVSLIFCFLKKMWFIIANFTISHLATVFKNVKFFLMITFMATVYYFFRLK